MNGKRAVFIGVVIAAVAFALFGGEYSMSEWLDLRRQEREERVRVTELRKTVDSLNRYAKQVESDPETQERIARENHGMLKPGEHAFIVEDAQNRKP